MLLFFACIAVSCFGNASAAIVTSDFSLGTGTPFGSTTALASIDVILTTRNTRPFGINSFRDQLNTDPAFVTFTFSTPIRDFTFIINRASPPDEFLTDFNIGKPTSLKGALVNFGVEITSSIPADFGTGSLIGSGLKTTTGSSTIGNLLSSTASPALAVDQFGINAVPIPSTIGLFGAGLIAIFGVGRRSQQNITTECYR